MRRKRAPATWGVPRREFLTWANPSRTGEESPGTAYTSPRSTSCPIGSARTRSRPRHRAPRLWRQLVPRLHRLVLVQMRQDDAVEAPVGAKVEEHELAVGLSLGQCRRNVFVGVRAPVVRALRARRGVRTKGERQEGGQRESLHTCLQGPTGILEVYTARALQGFSISASTSLAASA